MGLVYYKKMKHLLCCCVVAPIGCLQYHTDLTGNIRSFNYDPADGGHYQSNLDYAICIQRSPNTCRVEFNQRENSVFWINSADGLCDSHLKNRLFQNVFYIARKPVKKTA